MTRIAVLGRIPASGLELLRQAGDVWAWDHDEHIPDDVRDEQLATADAAVTLLTNKVDVAACERRGVVVTNTPGVLADATADLAMALILMLTRRLGEGERLIRSGEPWAWGMFMMLGTGIQGRQLGIIGMGGIGEALAARARAFGMQVVYHNRRPVAPELAAHLDAERLELDDLLATSDIVSVNCPYNADTHHLIDAVALARMKSSAFLVNTARGPIVDEAALADALRSGLIAGAALDVFENEPQVHPGLLDLDNAVLVPHLGSATVETRGAMAELAARNVVEVLAGHDPLTPVTPPPATA